MAVALLLVVSAGSAALAYSGWVVDADATLQASDATYKDLFGESVAADGNRIVVGAKQADHSAKTNIGAAYMFEEVAGVWTQTKKITSSTYVQSNANWGNQQSLQGDILVMGGYCVNIGTVADAGAAAIFYRNAGGANHWGQVATLTAGADMQAYANYGSSVRLNGDWLAIGAAAYDCPNPLWGQEGEDEFLVNKGKLYIYNRNQGGADAWGLVTTLESTRPAGFVKAGSEYMGSILQWQGNTLVSSGLNGEYITVWDTTGGVFTEEATIDGAARYGDVAGSWSCFGAGLSLNGDKLSAGGNMWNGLKGKAYVMDRDLGGTDNWGEERNVTGSDSIPDDTFGYTTLLSGNLLVAGAYTDDTANGANTGSAYAFLRYGSDLWEWCMLLPSGIGPGQEMGSSMAMLYNYGYEARVVIGGYGYIGGWGRAYVFTLGTPEPSSVVLLIAGALALIALRRVR